MLETPESHTLNEPSALSEGTDVCSFCELHLSTTVVFWKHFKKTVRKTSEFFRVCPMVRDKSPQ